MKEYLRGKRTLSKLEQRGWIVFLKLGCGQCHPPPNLTDNKFHDIGLPRRRLLLQTNANPGVPDRFELGFDFGRANISDRAEDMHRFRTPSLYNVMSTGPYMHNGLFASVDEVLDFYSRTRRDVGQAPIGPAEGRALRALFAAFSDLKQPKPPVPSCEPNGHSEDRK